MLSKTKGEFRKSSLVLYLAFVCSSVVLLLTCLCPAGVSAAEYSIRKDQKGVFMQTDEHGSWYIDAADLKTFKVGDRGVYSVWKDDVGTYLKTDKPGKFYIDMEARANIERDIRETNEKYERDMEEVQKEPEKKAAQEKEINTQKQAQERAIQAEQEAQERAIQAEGVKDRSSYLRSAFPPRRKITVR